MIIEFIVIFIVVLLISLILTAVFRREWPGQSSALSAFILFFIILLLATWAFGLWIRPFGPMLLGVYWLPFVIIGFLLGLLLTSLFSQRQPRNRREALQQADARKEARAVLGASFWTLLILLVGVIIVHYLV